MTPPIQFYAQGVPKGQPRPKAFARGGHAAVYDPGTAEGWKGQVALAARPHLPEQPMELPLYVQIDFFFPRPKAHYVGGKPERGIRDTAPVYHVSRPDLDNLAKACLDALTVIRMWHDDAQVGAMRLSKFYADGRGPGCLITIREA